MDRDLYLALDSGTSSCRALAFDVYGRRLGQAQRPLATAHPRPGWAEQDGEELWQAQLTAAREAIALAGGVGRFRGLAIANQRETSLIWHRSNLAPIGPAIVWHCRRTAERAAALERDRGAEIRRRTGLLPDACFAAPKLAWLLDQTPGAQSSAAQGDLAGGTVDSWLIAKLTNGEHPLTDRTNASRTLLYNLETESWDAELAAWCGVPTALLAEVRPSGARFGLSAAEHFGAPLPILAVAGDQQAALYGQLCDAPGPAKVTYGTGAFVLSRAVAGQRPADGLLLTAAADDHTARALEGGVFTAGAMIDWMTERIGLAPGGPALIQLAGSAPDSGDVLLLPALAGLGAPHWKPQARGVIAGLSAATRPPHLARAALEGIAFRVREIIEAMPGPIAELRVDGGLAQSELLLQIQANALQRPVLRPAEMETTALGAARLAVRADLDAPPVYDPSRTRIEPNADLGPTYARWSSLRAAAASLAVAGH